MSTIDFVVRDDAGNFQRGSMGEGTGQTAVALSDGADISLNLYPGQIAGYSRAGTALQVILANGETLTIEGFFNGTGEQVLFVSAGGELSQVNLVAGEGNVLYASYEEAGDFGKWSPLDDFFFLRGPEILVTDAAAVAAEDDGVGMLLTPLVGGLGFLSPATVGAAAVGAGVLGATVVRPKDGDDDGGQTQGEIITRPDVEITGGTQGTGHIVDGTDHADGVTITGTGEAGGAITVTIGDATAETVVDGDGNWTVTFPSDEVPGGTYEVPVTVVITDENGNTSTAEDIVELDTETFVSFDEDAVEGDGTANAEEVSDGVVLEGTVEAGSTVVVTVGGQAYEAVVEGTTWTCTLPASDVTGGEYELDVSVTATDALGNVATTSGTVTVDTVTTLTIDTASVETDGTVNRDERSDGVTIGGTAEAGATVVLTVSGTDYTTTAGSSGSWSVEVAASDIPSGTYDLEVSATSTDLAGNRTSTSGTIAVDTVVGVTIDTDIEGDGIVNAVEREDGITLSGTADAGAQVEVEFNGAVRTVTASGSGTWSADFTRAEVPAGEVGVVATATATDAAGNSASASGTVVIDTHVTNFGFDSAPVAGDDVINDAEADAGVTIGGTVEAGSTVVVNLGDASRTVDVGADGTWSATFTGSEIPPGETTVPVTVHATDRAGNTAVLNDSVVVDRIVSPLTGSENVTADDIVNAQEAASGITLAGTVEQGSSVTVTFEGTSRAATVAADGAWTVDFAASEIPPGTYTAAVSITATDAAGNVRTITDSFEIDTVAPEVPLVTSTDRGVDGLRSVGISEADEGIAVTSVSASGDKTGLGFEREVDTRYDEIDLHFDSPVSDGSQLVISSTDAAGNQNASLFVLDESGTNVVDVDNPGLEGFDIGSIDLHFALDSELTLSADDLHKLSRNDNELTIHGGSDDSVTIAGATATGESQTIGGRSYDIYSLGDEGGRVIIDEDINVII
ncbi:hypothetical protein OG2516_05278 [Oceanicola granulosus HTCC2516]|uniref:RTX family exoprotein n=1 Tax=Oceanicola granulosus (strain ATCC BAA-861 / DSM 15982 / KCTC 12143 / HTCC2516) TaxID=314256 RepID=Q2CIU6_OCEGH|nr:Ig-like domain-containing protein [Oceanicola granulosus]EAR52493.1 hypothetical protein OG2516_05278 [Oceanicola granulosus HTCC2516]